MKAGNFRIGQYVKYHGFPGDEGQKGRVKSIPDSEGMFVFVVFHCNDDWDEYQEYTGQHTNISLLTMY